MGDDPNESLFGGTGGGDSDGTVLVPVNCCRCCDEGGWAREACDCCGRTMRDSCTSVCGCVWGSFKKMLDVWWKQISITIGTALLVAGLVMAIYYWATGKNPIY